MIRMRYEKRLELSVGTDLSYSGISPSLELDLLCIQDHQPAAIHMNALITYWTLVLHAAQAS